MKLPITTSDSEMNLVVTHKGSSEQKRVAYTEFVQTLLGYVYAMTDFDKDSILDMYTDDTLTLKLSGTEFLKISQTIAKLTQGNNTLELTPTQLISTVVSTNHTNNTTSSGSSSSHTVTNSNTTHAITRSEAITVFGLLATILDKVTGPGFEGYIKIVKDAIEIKVSNIGAGYSTRIDLRSEGLELTFSAGSTLRINGNSGADGDFLTSKGANNAPVWSSVSYTGNFTPASWSGSTLTVNQSVHLLKPGLLQISVFDSSNNIVPIGATIASINCSITGTVTITLTNPILAFSGFIHLTR